MAYYNNIAQRSDLLERLLGTVASAFEAAAERRAKKRIFRSTFDELNALSNRELADLGLHRSELKRVAWDSANGIGA